MLIEFRVSNFRSIKDEAVLSLVASTGKELIRENTFPTGVKGFQRLTRSAVVYGPNAAGKSNLLIALQYMQSLVVNSANISEGGKLPYVPFRLSARTAKQPTEFEIAFIEDRIRYEYGFSVDADRIHSEWLIAYPEGRPQRWFERTYDARAKKYSWTTSSKLKGAVSVWRSATRQNALFLSIAIQLNSTQLQPVFHWFQKKLVIVGVGPSQFNAGLTYKLLETSDGKQKILDFVKAADFGILDVAIRREPLQGLNVNIAHLAASASPAVVRVTAFHNSIDSKEKIALDLSEESSGTQILLKSAGAWLNVLEKGEVLFIDEMDTSLHPHMTRFLISLMHDERTNKKDAQLVFTTHDTSLLDSDLFRRDQIWFIEKDSKSGSRLYPLTDFSPRKDEALERGYLRGRYGALPFIGELKI